jgi:hypothetical protein
LVLAHRQKDIMLAAHGRAAAAVLGTRIALVFPPEAIIRLLLGPQILPVIAVPAQPDLIFVEYAWFTVEAVRLAVIPLRVLLRAEVILVMAVVMAVLAIIIIIVAAVALAVMPEMVERDFMHQIALLQVLAAVAVVEQVSVDI